MKILTLRDSTLLGSIVALAIYIYYITHILYIYFVFRHNIWRKNPEIIQKGLDRTDQNV